MEQNRSQRFTPSLRERLTSRALGAELRLRALLASDRGDVPGWILITLMTSGLVVLIWALAGPALADVFDQAIRRVTGSVR